MKVFLILSLFVLVNEVLSQRIDNRNHSLFFVDVIADLIAERHGFHDRIKEPCHVVTFGLGAAYVKRMVTHKVYNIPGSCIYEWV